MLHLLRAWRYTLLLFKPLLGGSRPGCNSSATVVAHSRIVHICLVYDYGFVVDIVDIHRIHSRNRSVVKKPSATPITALESSTYVPEAIMDAAIIADVRAPISRVPHIYAPGVAPITGRPK
jgi:hypothetical protein